MLTTILHHTPSDPSLPLALSGGSVYLDRMALDFSKRIVSDPAVCNGQTVIKGTRVLLRTVLASLAEGATIQQILDDFPSLHEQDIRAVIAFAAASAEEDLPIPGMPSAL